MRETITPQRHHIDAVCSKLYKHYVVLIEVCRGTKQVKTIDEPCNIRLFHRKA